jgi:hypothetical protein
MTSLLLYAADAFCEPPSYALRPARAVKTALLELARFSFVVDAPATSRQRSSQLRSWRRLEDAAQMVVRRGAGRCLNLSCGARANASGYCPPCEHNPAVQRTHNTALKSIGTLWDGAMGGALGRLAALENTTPTRPSAPTHPYAKALETPKAPN